MEFRKLSNRQVVDLLPYAVEFLRANPKHKIYVGSDSQNNKRVTVYVTVIVFHGCGGGGHVLFSKTTLPRINDRFTRLWKEVEFSIEAAEQLKALGLPPIESIDLDLNPDPKYGSNNVLRSAVGYVESLGYTARIKPHATMASCVADSIASPNKTSQRKQRAIIVE